MANADRSSAVASVQDALSSAMESMLAEYRRTSTDPRAAEAFAQRIRAQQAAFYDRLEQVIESAPATPVQPRSGPYEIGRAHV